MTLCIYLCGPMTGMLPENACGWRESVIEELAPYGFILASPLRVEGKHLKKDRAIEADHFGERSRVAEMRPSAIYERDLFDVRHADIVLANLNEGSERVSIGSVYELGYADRCDPKPTIIMVARPGNIYREHSLTSQGAGVIFDELPHAVAYIKSNYAPYVKELLSHVTTA